MATNIRAMQQEQLEAGPNFRFASADHQSGEDDKLSSRVINMRALRMAAAEMIGTFLLMFAVSGIIASTKLSSDKVGLLEYALTGGLAVVLIMFAVGHISGAHVNPSITVALAAFCGFSWSKVLYYVPAQMVGSVLGTCVGKLVYNMEADFANTRPLHGVKIAFFAEMMATLVLMFLAASLSNLPRSVAYISPFIIGAAIALAILLTEPASGGSLNPARSFGPAIVSWSFDSIWLYITAPTIGAVAGAFLFKILNYPRVVGSGSVLTATLVATSS